MDTLGMRERQDRAYGLVAGGIQRALEELHPMDAEYGRLVRCLSHARRRAGLPQLVLVQPPRLSRKREAAVGTDVRHLDSKRSRKRSTEGQVS